jgi:hypothetical protein
MNDVRQFSNIVLSIGAVAYVPIPIALLVG